MSPSQLVQAYHHAIGSQDGALAAQSERSRQHVHTKYATGTGNINNDFSLDVAFRLVFVRCHFVAGAGSAGLTISNNSSQGSAYNTRLQVVATAGTNNDVFLIPTGDNVADPSAWSFQAGDAINIKWTNPAPGTMTWGLEVGLAIAA